MEEQDLYKAIRQYFNYSPETGIFTRKIARGKERIGAIAGSDNGKGYIVIRFNGKNYAAARLAWLYHYGSAPKNCIDHINGIKNDNRIANLRDVTATENQRNRRLNKNNKYGVMGLYFRDGKWEARINLKGKEKWLGRYDTFDLAYEARKKAELKHGFHKNHGLPPSIERST